MAVQTPIDKTGRTTKTGVPRAKAAPRPPTASPITAGPAPKPAASRKPSTKAGDVGTKTTQSKSRPVVSAAATKSRAVVSTAKDEGRSLGRVAAQSAKSAFGAATSETNQLASTLIAEARGLLDEASSQLREQAEQQGEKLIDGIRRLGEQIDALAEGHPDQAGPFDDYIRDLGERINDFANQLDDEGFEGLLKDVERVARRRPGLFLLGAAAMGVGAGRLLRATTGSKDSDEEYQQLPPAGRPALEPGIARAGRR